MSLKLLKLCYKLQENNNIDNNNNNNNAIIMCEIETNEFQKMINEVLKGNL